MTTVNTNNIKNKCSTRINQGEISLIIFICLGIRHRMKACLHPSLHQMWVMIVLGPVTGKGWQPTTGCFFSFLFRNGAVVSSF